MKDHGSPLYQLTLLALSVYVLTVLVAESLFIEDPETKQVLQYIDLGICLIFLADFFVNLFTAESKLGYLKWGWLDFISSVPVIDTLRWGRLSRVIRILRPNDPPQEHAITGVTRRARGGVVVRI